jgi:hypothetical protein
MIDSLHLLRISRANRRCLLPEHVVLVGRDQRVSRNAGYAEPNAYHRERR